MPGGGAAAAGVFAAKPLRDRSAPRNLRSGRDIFRTANYATRDMAACAVKTRMLRRQ
jgi:hypothetical protein